MHREYRMQPPLATPPFRREKSYTSTTSSGTDPYPMNLHPHPLIYIESPINKDIRINTYMDKNILSPASGDNGPMCNTPIVLVLYDYGYIHIASVLTLTSYHLSHLIIVSHGCLAYFKVSILHEITLVYRENIIYR